MELIALGTGNSRTKKNWQSNFLFRQNQKTMALDFGTYAPLALEENHMTTLDLDAIYISHLHADHTGGLEELLFDTYFNPKAKRPTLYCQGEYIRDSESNTIIKSGLVSDLWDHTLSGGAIGLEGKIATLDTYFDVRAVKDNSSFIWEGVKFDIVQTIHICAKYRIENSFGLMWNDPDTKERIYITTDTQFCPVNAAMAYLREADIIYHDCETTPFKSGVHAHYSELVTLPAEIKAKMWLYHFDDSIIMNWDVMNEKAKNDGFLGFVPTGAVFDLHYNKYSVGMIGKQSHHNEYMKARNAA